MRNKKKFQIGFDDVLVVMILLFTLAFMVYLGWEVALFVTAFVGVFGPIMSTLGGRRDNYLVIEQYRSWSDPKK